MTDDNSRPNDDLETRSADGSSGDKRPLTTIDRIASVRIDKTISSGGGGTVFLAYDESMKRKVALKVLHPSLSITPTAQQRFAREAWIAGQLEHANIIKVYSRGEEKQLHYIAMEFADGGSLSDYIKNLRETTSASKDITATANREHIKFIVSNFIELVGAVEHIHSRGFIHRDIKPHNILLSGESKQFKLTDFGIAHAEDMTRMTKAGDFMGTIHYMSPEQISAHRTKVDKRTDIYSLGVTLYEALTLSLPFEGDSEEQLIGEIIAGHYIPARKRTKTIPRDLETILIKATHHDPGRRYQSAMDFAEDLLLFSEDRPISAKRDNIFYKARKSISFKKKGVLTGLAIMVVALSAGIINEQRLQTAYDIEKILYSLKRAVETKTSPFEFEPDWPRLSKKLYEHVKSGQKDSIVIWFLKATAVPHQAHSKYSKIDRAKIFTHFIQLRLFDTLQITALPSVVSMSAVTYSSKTLHFHVKGISEFTTWYCYYPYTQAPTSNVTSYFDLSYLVDTTQSLAIIPVDISTSHYLGALLYSNTIGNDLNLPENIKQFTESQMKYLSPIVNGTYSMKKDPFIYIIDTSSLSVASPVFIDTITDTVKMWTFREWPDDFPKMIRNESQEERNYQDFSINEIFVVRQKRDIFNKEFEIQIAGYVGKNKLIVPFAGNFYIQANNIEDTILSGQIVRGWSRDLKLFHDHEEADLDLKRYKPIPTEGNMKWWFTSNNIGIDSATFNKLVSLGITRARLVVVPSIHAARLSGNIEQFWGDTLIFNITFQAIDSTGVQAKQHTEKVSKERLGSILFDSTFLIKYH